MMWYINIRVSLRLLVLVLGRWALLLNTTIYQEYFLCIFRFFFQLNFEQINYLNPNNYPKLCEIFQLINTKQRRHGNGQRLTMVCSFHLFEPDITIQLHKAVYNKLYVLNVEILSVSSFLFFTSSLCFFDLWIYTNNEQSFSLNVFDWMFCHILEIFSYFKSKFLF